MKRGLWSRIWPIILLVLVILLWLVYLSLIEKGGRAF
jgi:hypothetical protein